MHSFFSAIVLFSLPMHFSIFVFRVRSTMLSFTSGCENSIPVLIPPTEEHFDSIRRRGFPNIASALLHRVSCKHRTSETSEPPEAFSFWLLYFNILHKVTVLFVLSLYFVYPCWPTVCFCVWVFGCVRERHGKGERERIRRCTRGLHQKSNHFRA